MFQAANQIAYSELLPLDLPQDTVHKVRWGRLHGSAQSLLIATVANKHPGLVLVVTPNSQSALRLQAELDFFAQENSFEIFVFPDWETLPYDNFSPHQDIVSQRLATLHRLPQRNKGVLIVSATTLMQRLSPQIYLDGHVLLLKTGERIDAEAFRSRLEAAGYLCVSQVTERGEFAVRGSLIDVFPMGSEHPYRLDLFDDELESIRTFDPDSQRSIGKVPVIELLPAREFPLTKDAVSRFRQAFRSRFEGDPQRSLIYREVSSGLAPGGIEYYFPLFFESTATLFDYLPSNVLALTLEDTKAAMDAFWEQITERYEQRRYDRERPLLPPHHLFLDKIHVFQALEKHPQVEIQQSPVLNDGVNFPSNEPPEVYLQPRAEQPVAALQAFLTDFPGRVLLAVESTGRREVLLDTLRPHGLVPKPCGGWQAFLNMTETLAIAIAPVERGLLLREPDLAVIAETQLYREWVPQTRRRAPSRDADAIIRNLTDLHMGDPVVHEYHGVGRYAGLKRLETAGLETEFVVLNYADGGTLYVPVASLHLLSRYAGHSLDKAPLHKLGSEQWVRAKRRAAERVKDVAAELLDIYARRRIGAGHVFRQWETEYATFAAAFPFEETPDQQAAIAAVVADMGRDEPMDRVICGDVGFGKTEVAMRAAFIAVHDGRQVAVLVPTTLLAQQHHQNFQDRFADWPVRIEVLSRFQTKREQQQVCQGLRQGTVDIVIGTHKLIQGDIAFKQLGLVVIDEEHRFGVRQKERLKALRAQVDMLTLTATPIPRTLNMAMAGLRDLSIIATPPAQRLAIKTFVGEWNKTWIQEACQRELKRGGQVYFLHNDITTIERQAKELQTIIPDARLAIAHGQMPERQLEQVMLDFYHQRCNILVCTTIIESGIDVPTANTIIINRADKLGLAQLYQLRGRVGRSRHRAYAHLVVPPRKAMNADARKRIDAIEAIEDLGAGFTLANHDLEIRGAGELLGDEQSGQMQEIGFSLYMELLERAVATLKKGDALDLDRPLEHGPEIDLQCPALIPDPYLPDVHTRLILYKRIANAQDFQELRDLQVEMIDRFGLLPEAVKNLFRVTQLKLIAIPIKIRKIDVGAKGGRILFGLEPNIDLTKLLQLIQQQPKIYQLDGQDKLRFCKEMDNVEERVDTVKSLLEELSI
jgi:transcription-repair coupling factor (superfamily II helicase)